MKVPERTPTLRSVCSGCNALYTAKWEASTDGDGAYGVILEGNADSLRPLHEVVSGLPGAVSAVMGQALVLNAGRRSESVVAMRLALKHARVDQNYRVAKRHNRARSYGTIHGNGNNSTFGSATNQNAGANRHTTRNRNTSANSNRNTNTTSNRSSD